ncbi:LAQU0S23e00980g1_1 [Lachancea quebecensis]|uniref:LAQU0S23e00980g1_1 n=1 Tax=Lachancea quebecensis TaxID=1654605 RepID=A0A0P1KYA4_9SACH|nr:LAQU0S23e00980g1_1 [Lachancea quebecensis]
MGSGQLSPQKEQEIALKILERAELAQMTRQLRVGLSKVATPKKSSREGVKPSSRLSPVKFEIPRNIQETDRISPLKRDRSFGSQYLGEECSSSLEDGTSPSKMQKRPTTPPRVNNKLNGGNAKIERDEISDLLVPRTPKSSHGMNDVGADLLMYLATSPYTSTNSGQAPQTPSTMANNVQTRAPTTPSYPPQNSSSDAVRLSQLKSQTTPPQLGFKVPGHNMASSTLQETPSQQGASYSEIMDSPGTTFYVSSPQKPKPGFGGNSSTSLQVPGTPSRELRSAHLLKTPNFNMGDYVHNLFSPSPRVTSGSIRDTKKD